MRLLTLVFVFAALLAGPAAARPVTLKAQTLDLDGQVTLSDLFDDAGPAGAAPVAVRTGGGLVLDARQVQALARRAGLDWANPDNLQRIVVRGAAPGAAPSRGNVEVLTYSRSLAAGEVVAAEDLIYAPLASAPADAPRDAEVVVGLAARRPLRAGAAVSLRDVSAPQVIKSGDPVTVTYADGGVTLTLLGKAMAGAAAGELLPVLNTSSKKIIQTVARGPGQAVVGPDAVRGPAQLALR